MFLQYVITSNCWTQPKCNGVLHDDQNCQIKIYSQICKTDKLLAQKTQLAHYIFTLATWGELG